MVTTVIGDWNEFIANLIVGGANKLQIGDVLIQWGLHNSSGGNTLTFPIAYTTAPSVVGSVVSTSTIEQDAYVVHGQVSTTEAEFEVRAILDTGVGTTDVFNNTSNVQWIAIGINNA